MARKEGKKPLVVGILAHVDAGKTTLSEAMLYESGNLRKLGRVDHKDAFLDTFALERERGITIFSKQALLPLPAREVMLLDTPGHVDFSSEMERTLQVLDYAVLVISGTDGVQGHTRTLWRLLKRHHIPTFLFVNKMDLPGADAQSVLVSLQKGLDKNCLDFTQRESDSFQESLALCSEESLQEYLETGSLSQDTLTGLIFSRRVFPCFFGSALRLEGVSPLLNALEQDTLPPVYPEEFGAKVYKIARDNQGARLTYLKVTGGSLRVKEALRGPLEGEGSWEEKADQLRLYSGEKYRMVEEVPAGMVCAVTGLTHTYPGQGLGCEPSSPPPVLEPVLTYQVKLPKGCDPHTALLLFRQLEEEDPQLHVVWNEALGELHVQLMGEVQLEVLRRLVEERFGLQVEFDTGNIVYRETIAEPVEGVGHFEPLRHYAEVHLLLEPGERGSGLAFASKCSEDVLERSWQRLILTHLEEKEHLGVLTGSPITDMKITLTAGRAHLKHTEGGDFRQATYRAVRQGLKSGQSVLLEPYYEFTLEVPPESVGRAMSDLQRMDGEYDPPNPQGELTLLTGRAPVACLRDYALEVTAYTRGKGQLTCTFYGYLPCHNAQQVIQEMGYDSDRDLENPADSVFCAHGAGFPVKWDQVPKYMHLPSTYTPPKTEEPEENAPASRPSRLAGPLVDDKELEAIFRRTYGDSPRRDLLYRRPQATENPEKELENLDPAEEYLLVDGYNIIFAWEDLKKLARTSIDAARQALMDILSNYQGFRQCALILVFDAYRVPRETGEVSKYHGIYVVYTKEAETADQYIEKTTYALGKQTLPNGAKRKIRVATSDAAEQLIILGHGALRVSARLFREEVARVNGQIAQLIQQLNSQKWASTLGDDPALCLQLAQLEERHSEK